MRRRDFTSTREAARLYFHTGGDHREIPHVVKTAPKLKKSRLLTVSLGVQEFGAAQDVRRAGGATQVGTGRAFRT